LFLNSIPKRTPSGYDWKQCGFLHGLFLTLSIPPILDMGDNLKEHKGDVFSIEKIMDRKKPFEWFNHLSMESTSIWNSNIGVSKLTSTLKGWCFQRSLLTKMCLLLEVSEGSRKNYPSHHSFVVRGIPWATV
jgi:hypothetical protein